MAVSEGSGPLQVGKPITVNDFMEAIAPPGLKPASGHLVRGETADNRTGLTDATDDHICFVGGAGYTEVVDDIIVEVTSLLSGATALEVGLKTDGDTADETRFITGASIPAAVGTYSVLRGTFAWATDGNTEAKRTIAAGSGGGGVLTYTVNCTSGHLRIYARTHYTAVNHGPGL